MMAMGTVSSPRPRAHLASGPPDAVGSCATVLALGSEDDGGDPIRFARLAALAPVPLAFLATPLMVGAQTGRKVPSIGYPCTYSCGGPRYQALVDSLEKLDYVNGRTVTLMYPGYPASEPQNLNQLSVIAADMVPKKVDVIFVAEDVFAARAAKQATSIPIVMAISGIPSNWDSSPVWRARVEI